MLKIGIIGAGKMGRAHAGALEGVRGAKLAGVVGRNEDRAAKLAREHGAKAYASMEALVDAEQPGRAGYLSAERPPSGLRASRRGTREACLLRETDRAEG